MLCIQKSPVLCACLRSRRSCWRAWGESSHCKQSGCGSLGGHWRRKHSWVSLKTRLMQFIFILSIGCWIQMARFPVGSIYWKWNFPMTMSVGQLVVGSVSWSVNCFQCVCHDFLTGWEVSLPSSYWSTFFKESISLIRTP